MSFAFSLNSYLFLFLVSRFLFPSYIRPPFAAAYTQTHTKHTNTHRHTQSTSWSFPIGVIINIVVVVVVVAVVLSPPSRVYHRFKDTKAARARRVFGIVYRRERELSLETTASSSSSSLFRVSLFLSLPLFPLAINEIATGNSQTRFSTSGDINQSTAAVCLNVYKTNAALLIPQQGACVCIHVWGRLCVSRETSRNDFLSFFMSLKSTFSITCGKTEERIWVADSLLENTIWALPEHDWPGLTLHD